MAKIFNFPALSKEEHISNMQGELAFSWFQAANKSELNSFVLRNIPSADPEKNYLNSVDAIASLELKLNIGLQIIAPGFFENASGWIAGFNYLGINYSSPFLEREEHARVFAVMLYQKIKRELHKK